ncbi:hypothetical protein BS50DRAFT_580249 [Corynespora cassiicola Philippines]|uniref:Altered inheritance of mitochondria protein 6 n=1 Tax=Corynespora cassiicola Philippines TaxID=1448308 RepID=A0A2T2N0W2_CORCC|nr:hypothetical protein BS50DRAFT_580249 [Corynespora cassiicola Philippines]
MLSVEKCTDWFSGLVHLFNVFLLYVPLLLDDYSPSYPTWPQPGDVPSPGQDPPSNITQDVQPIPCHSHNDYWRQIPLYEALHYGCTGVEADVWLFDNDLYVGHSTNALTRDKTFQSMYIDPLVKMLDQQNTPSEFTTLSNNTTSGPKNGVFQLAPTQTLVLLVDFKNSGPAILPFVHSQLSPLRDRGYLSFYDGHTTHSRPITVVATGNAPFNLLTANTAYRDIFFDAPLDRLYEPPSQPHPDFNDRPPGPPLLSPRDGQGTVGTTPDSVFNASNSYYASVSFRASIGYLWRGRLSAAQLERIRGQVRGARARGLKARYWSTPAWPVGLRNHVWEVLVREGADILNGDGLVEITRVDWRGRKHGGVMG